MRRLAQPQVMTSAAIAAVCSAVLSLPRLLLWDKRPFSVWYPEAIILFCGFVLWAFVFAWHTEYTHRPVFTSRIKPVLFITATLVGILAGLAQHWIPAPFPRARTPKVYPADLQHWIATTLFTLAFAQLFLLYAPFAWAVRLFHNEQAALWFTVVLSILVVILKNNSSPSPLPHSMLLELLTIRIASTYFAVWFYLRGGIFLVWWLALLVEARHLLTYAGF